MRPQTKAAAVIAVKVAGGLTIGFILGPIVMRLAVGAAVPEKLIAEKLIVGISLFPVLFFGLWAWGVLSKKNPITGAALDPERPKAEVPETEGKLRNLATSKMPSIRNAEWMQSRTVIILGLLIAGVVATGWAFRFDTIPVKTGAAFFKVNRWTGTTYLCSPSSCREVKDEAHLATPKVEDEAPLAPPKVGEVVDGYRFLGGDPSQEASWAKVETTSK